MTQQQPEDKNRIKRQKSEQAIRFAKEGRWDEAVQVNRDLLGIFPDDSETLNRLGKALMELKRYPEAKDAYEKAVKNDPSNLIAQKNLQRLVQLVAAMPANTTSVAATTSAVNRTPLNPADFIEQTGKTGYTNLVNVAPTKVLARLTAGDPVFLVVDTTKQALLVKNEEGEVLGQVEPRLGMRLMRFLEAGNRYVARVQSVGEHQLRIVIQETYQHPSQRGKMSFPPKTGAAGYRAYTKEGVVRERYADDEDYDYENEEAESEEEPEGEEEAEVSEDFIENEEPEDFG